MLYQAEASQVSRVRSFCSAIKRMLRDVSMAPAFL